MTYKYLRKPSRMTQVVDRVLSAKQTLTSDKGLSVFVHLRADRQTLLRAQLQTGRSGQVQQVSKLAPPVHG